MNVNGAVASADVTVLQDSAEGDVSFNITAFDLAGNNFTANQTQLNSSNVTIDSSIPGVQNLNVVSDNVDPEFAMAEDTITVTLQVSEQIATSTIQILNNDITMIVNNDTASATVTVQHDSQNGPVEFTITAYDKTGNVFNVTPENVTGSNVTIDTNDPSLADLTIYSNNANTSLATINNILSITITANEALKAADITILGSTSPMSVNDAVATASVTVPQNSVQGNVLFDITAYDLAGNSFTVDQTQLSLSNVIIDHSIPNVQTLNVVSDNSNPEFAMAEDTITVTLQVSEQIENSTLQILGTTITMIVNNDTASATVTVQHDSQNGPVEFTITAYDKTGNVFNVEQDRITGNNVVIDTNNPSLTDLTIYSNNANTSLATINNTLSITITANEAIRNADITILGSTYVMNVSGAVASADVTVLQDSAEGDVSFNITAFDLAGNNFTADQTQLNSSNVIIDRTNPQLVDLVVYSNNNNPSLAMIGNVVNITLNVTESLQNATIAILNNAINMTVVNDTAYTTVMVSQNSSNGPIEFNITAYDRTGNILNVTQNDITSNNTVIDTIDPSLLDLTISSNNTNPSFAKVNDIVTITLTANETIGSISVTVLGQPINANINGAIATASISVDQNTTNDFIEFSINITDTNGAYMASFTNII